MSDVNVVSLASSKPDAGYRQQRYRRKQTKPRKRRGKTPPGEPPPAAGDTANTTAPPDAAVSETSSVPNDMVTFSGGPTGHLGHGVMRDTTRAEFSPNAAPEQGDKSDALDWLARSVAVGMACVTAYFSIHGLLTLFPGREVAVTVFGIGVECLKLVGVMYLSAHARSIWWLWRWAAITAIIIAAGLNSASVYAQFASLHASSPAAAAATREAAGAELDGRIEAVKGRVDDLTRRAAAIDDTVDGAGSRGKFKGAKWALDSTRKDRAGIAADRERAANELAGLKAERGRVTASGHQAVAEELPVTLMASLFGTDAATVLRWLVCAVVTCGDPAALVLLAAVGSRRRREGGAT